MLLPRHKCIQPAVRCIEVTCMCYFGGGLPQLFQKAFQSIQELVSAKAQYSQLEAAQWFTLFRKLLVVLSVRNRCDHRSQSWRNNCILSPGQEGWKFYYGYFYIFQRTVHVGCMCFKQPHKLLSFLSFSENLENLDAVTHCGNELYLGTFTLSEVDWQVVLSEGTCLFSFAYSLTAESVSSEDKVRYLPSLGKILLKGFSYTPPFLVPWETAKLS